MPRRGAAARGPRGAEDWAAITRTARGPLSRPEFAPVIGVSVASLENWEYGRAEPNKRHHPQLRALAAAPRTTDPVPPSTDAVAAPVVSYATRSEWSAGGRMRFFTVFRGPRKQRVAEGVEFANGAVALCWDAPSPATAVGIGVYEDLQAVCALHGHDGPMEIVVRDL